MSMQSGMQPIHIAAMCGHLDVLKYLANIPGIDAKEKNVVSLLFTLICKLSLIFRRDKPYYWC